jgi:cytochrome c-type biogenesis protein CcmH/NrfG
MVQPDHRTEAAVHGTTLAQRSCNGCPRAALSELRSRVGAVRKDPAWGTAELRNFLASYSERATQCALEAAAKAQQGAAIGSWVTFGVMIATLAVSFVGAMGGIPSLRRWARYVVEARG